MRAAEIRRRFVDYFVRHGHTHVPSSSLVPREDPTLLFTNAGMVQFKATFLGQESRPYDRATTVQKCVRAGGKHNDLEQVGQTARHHTFFEMLGNFSFGDYFKREAIAYAWELVTEEYGLEPERLWATVHHTDDEAFELWQEVAGLSPDRIKRFGDVDNFWQMADVGPCGPCSEIHYDQRPSGAPVDLTQEQFAELGEAGAILELWNLVFMQYERDEAGELHPLPSPSIDTGAGLERIAAVLQGADSNFHTDLFLPLIARAEDALDREYEPATETGVSFRVLADHARAVAFLLADGVFPTSEGRGYVLRRILRRAVRHAWLLGRREPILVDLCDEVVSQMNEAYPELETRHEHILRTTRAEEERFMATIDEGMARFEEVAPEGRGGTISGADAFRLYDTYGFPLDLTQLMARERGYEVDVAGFERALEVQRQRSRQEREKQKRRGELEVEGPAVPEENWERYADTEQRWVGYDELSVDTEVLAAARTNGRVFLELAENPFYAEAGGQVSDRGSVEGNGWRLEVEEVLRQDDRIVIAGPIEGEFRPGRVRAAVDRSRLDTQRNHTATHLLHAALREVLGEHVTQAGSLVAPDRLRFDFTHTGPLTPEERDEIERRVNEQVWANKPITREHMEYREAIDQGAMALFGEKYGDRVRVVGVPGFSLELCGGCHVRTTGEIGLFRIVSETGSAAGVRRIEAVTGPAAYERVQRQDATLAELAAELRAPESALPDRVRSLQEENRKLQQQVRELAAGGDVVDQLIDDSIFVDGDTRIATGTVELPDSDSLRALGDRLRERLGTGVGLLHARIGDKRQLFAVVTDDLISRGLRADRFLQEVEKVAGGTGGGRPHMAQGSTGSPEQVDEALRKAPEIVKPMLEAGSG